MAKAAAMLVALALVVVAATSAGGASAQQCDAAQLAECGPAFIFGSPPTPACCSKLREQQPCFCEYARDPAYSGYLSSPTARRALASCNITAPSC